MKISAVVLAAGRGERFGGDKLSETLGAKPVWRWSLDAFMGHPLVDEVGIVVHPSRIREFEDVRAEFVVAGGANRQESSRIGVERCSGAIALVHDAARPFIDTGTISRVIEAIERTGAAAPGVTPPDTLRTRAADGYCLVDRTQSFAMQTPQGARRELLLRAHRAAAQVGTDEMALIEAISERFEIVEGAERNFKITTAADLARARAIVEGVESRTGYGYDIHRFSPDPSRVLILGGAEFPGSPGLEGHSDADVVIHAVVDALLGAAGLGDIGQHFPNTDPRWRGEPSSTFLRFSARSLADAGWRIGNVDITLIGEQPKVMPRAEEICTHLAEALGIARGQVNLKATTNEGLGALGRGEGLAAHAVATIRR